MKSNKAAQKHSAKPRIMLAHVLLSILFVPSGEMLRGIDEGLDQMDGAVVGGGDRNHWWWALASATQFGWGIRSYANGYAGDSRLMPLKAFAVASLFVGAAASASFGVLQAHGIHKVKDFMQLGANIRTRLGLPPRAQDKSSK